MTNFIIIKTHQGSGDPCNFYLAEDQRHRLFTDHIKAAKTFRDMKEACEASDKLQDGYYIVQPIIIKGKK